MRAHLWLAMLSACSFPPTNNPSGTDEDDDGVPFVDDCDDTDPLVGHTVYPDADGDGFGDDAKGVVIDWSNDGATCEVGPGRVLRGGDCDDVERDVNPDAAEVCDDAQRDEDCSGDADDEDPNLSDKFQWCVDGDGDEVGGTDDCVESCRDPEDGQPRVQVGYGDEPDCNDGDPAVAPGKPEVACDHVDSDCDGLDGVAGEAFYLDVDGDGFGAGPEVEGCPGRPYADNDDDCDDDDPRESPGGVEVCDDLDNDCDGTVDNLTNVIWYRDDDLDGRGDPAAPSQPRGCTPPAGSWSLLPYDCDSDEPFDNWWLTFDDVDGDEHGDSAAVAELHCEPFTTTSYGDCDPADEEVWLEIDSCNSSVSAFCGDREQTCRSATHHVSGSWDGTAPRTVWVGDWDGDGLDDVALGVQDFRSIYSAPFEDQNTWPDEVRVWLGGEATPMVLRLPFTDGVTSPSNIGITQALLGDFDVSGGLELAIVVADPNNAVVGSVWLVSDPPVRTGVTDLTEGANVRRIAMPDPGRQPDQAVGYDATVGDVDGDGADDLVLTAPSAPYTDLAFVVFGELNDQVQVASLEDAAVARLEDDTDYADSLGIDVAFVPALDQGVPRADQRSAVALTALGSNFDQQAALVFPEDLWEPGPPAHVSAAHAWYEFTGFRPPRSHQYGPHVAWADVGGDPAKPDLVAAVSDDLRARAYVFFDVADDEGIHDEADVTADLVLDLPFHDCVDVAVAQGSTLIVACDNAPYVRGDTDPGLVLTLDLADFPPGRVPQAVTTDVSDQISWSAPQSMLKRPFVLGDAVYFHHTTYQDTVGYSTVTLP